MREVSSSGGKYGLIVIFSLGREGVVDILYLIIKRGAIVDSRELDEDVRVEYDRRGAIVGIEIANARKNLARPLAANIAKGLRAA